MLRRGVCPEVKLSSSWERSRERKGAVKGLKSLEEQAPSDLTPSSWTLAPPLPNSSIAWRRSRQTLMRIRV